MHSVFEGKVILIVCVCVFFFFYFGYVCLISFFLLLFYFCCVHAYNIYINVYIHYSYMLYIVYRIDMI